MINGKKAPSALCGFEDDGDLDVFLRTRRMKSFAEDASQGCITKGLFRRATRGDQSSHRLFDSISFYVPLVTNADGCVYDQSTQDAAKPILDILLPAVRFLKRLDVDEILGPGLEGLPGVDVCVGGEGYDLRRRSMAAGTYDQQERGEKPEA